MKNSNLAKPVGIKIKGGKMEIKVGLRVVLFLLFAAVSVIVAQRTTSASKRPVMFDKLTY